MKPAATAVAAPRASFGSGLALGFIVLAVVLVHAGALRPGHDWSDDYAMYVSHALNLMTGRPYAETGYIPNPWAVPGPATYPPVYPIFIAPWVAHFGTDLHMLKLFGLAMFAAALITGYVLMRPRVGTAPALAGVTLLGLNPYFIAFRDEIRPDTMFLFLFLLTLLLGERWSSKMQPFDVRRVAQGVLLGAVAYLAYGTRSVGIVLLPALALTELWRLRRLGPVLVTAFLVWFALAAAQTMFLHADAGYAKLLTLDPHTLIYNAYSYTVSLALLWTNGLSAPWGFGLRTLLFVTVTAVACIGYAACVRRGPTVLEVIPWLYMLPLIVYWVGTMIQQRYMLPLFPLYLYYTWVGLGILRSRFTTPWPGVLLLSLGACVALSYASAYAHQSAGEIQPGITDTAALQVFEYVRDHTPADAVVLVGRARAFALYGQRRCVSPYGFRSNAALWGLIGEHHVTHMVVGLGALAREMDYEHPDDLAQFVAENPQRLQRTFRNAEFEVYTILSARLSDAPKAQ